jgi:DNA-binding Xre family transcriptional regulator
MIYFEVTKMRVTIKEYLEKNNHSIYWLMKETNMSKKAIYDLVSNKTDGIKFKNLEKICTA